jgi:hypothetical protein
MTSPLASLVYDNSGGLMEEPMDVSSLVAAQLSADNQLRFDPEEFDLAIREATEQRERWARRLAMIKAAWPMLRWDGPLWAWLAKPAGAK